MRLGFGDCVFDLAARELTREGERVHLAPKTFVLLALLLESRPRVVTKNEIHDRVWPGVFVSESSLARLAAELRSALGDDSRAPQFIRTVHGSGYAFAAAVQELGGKPAAPPPPLTLLLGDQVLQLQTGANLVGRGDDVAIRIATARVSRVHARIEVAGLTATIEDLGSKNGTFVCGKRITGKVTLRDGDEICVGPALLVFCHRSSPPSTETGSESPGP